jgi:hypothetical protein
MHFNPESFYFDLQPFKIDNVSDLLVCTGRPYTCACPLRGPHWQGLALVPAPDPARETGQGIFGFGSGSNDSNFNISDFSCHSLFIRKEIFIRSSAHVILVTVTKLIRSIDRCDATCALRNAHRVTVGLHLQVCCGSVVGACNVKLTPNILRGPSNYLFWIVGICELNMCYWHNSKGRL